MQSTDVKKRTKWIIDPAHSEIAFKVKHLVFSNVSGRFRDYVADIYTEGLDFTTLDINLQINAASIDTRNEQRDAHLTSADFFDTEQYKVISFTSNKVTATADPSRYQLSGELTMKSISKPVTLELEFGGQIKDPWGAEKALFSLNGKINRTDWGLNYNAALEAGGLLVGEQVTINCEVQLTSQP